MNVHRLRHVFIVIVMMKRKVLIWRRRVYARAILLLRRTPMNKKGMVLLSLNHDLAPLHIAYHYESCTVEPLNNGHLVVSHQPRPIVAGTYRL